LFQELFVVSRTKPNVFLIVSRTRLNEFYWDVVLFQGHNSINSTAMFLLFQGLFVVSRTKLDVLLIVSRIRLDEFY
jgi:hypothetical protein